jgi:A/G-specific adenine glycosylase
LQTFPKSPFPEKRAFQRSLLRWYTRHKRDLSWRRDQDPYRILVSEFMLQQTRVETVLPYYERFLKAFPSLEALARAPLQSVLKAWAGLGYYARARHLHAAVKTIRRDHGGKVPSRKKELLSLPGFGPYTAGAVASLAFNEPAAALDGNVKRLLGRLRDFREEASAGSRKNLLEKAVEELIPPGQASDFNQAMMDLGAMICVPFRPRCSDCPVKGFCAFRATEPNPLFQPSPLVGEGSPCGVSSSTPQGEGGGDSKRSSIARIEDEKIKRKKKKIRKEVWAVAVVEEAGRLLLHRKEGKGLLAGLWQFPTAVVNGEKISKRADAGTIKNLAKESGGEMKTIKKVLREKFGLSVKIKGRLPIKEHQFTHLRVTMKPFLCSVVEIIPGGPVPQNVRWIKPSSLSHYPISRAMGKITGLILSPS